MRAVPVASLLLASLFANPLFANSAVWNPDPSGPYGFSYPSTANPQHGTFTTTFDQTIFKFNFGSGLNAATRPGVITDLANTLGTVNFPYEFDFTANGYSFVSTATPHYGSGLTVSVAAGVTATWNAPGSGAFIKDGDGTAILAKAFGGQAIIEAGTLQLSAANLLTGDYVATSPGSTLALGNTSQSADTMMNNGTVTASGGNFTLNNLTNAGALNLTGGELVVTTLVANGTITAAPTSSTTLDGDITVTSLSGFGNITLNGTFLNAGGNATLDYFAGNLSGNGSLIKIGTGELILLGTTSLTGTRGAPAFSVNAGTLAGNTGSLTGAIVVLNTATLLFAQSANGTFSGNITGNGTILTNGLNAGTVINLPASSSFSGNLQAGNNIILPISADAQLGTLVTVTGGQKGGGTTTTTTYATFTFDGGTLRTTASITSPRPFIVTSNGGTFDTNNFASTIIGPITSTGNGTLNVTGNGNLTLFTSASLHALAINSANLALTKTALTLNSTATALSLFNANLSLSPLSSINTTGAVFLGGASNLTLSGSTIHSGNVSLGANYGDNSVITLSTLPSSWIITGDLLVGKDAFSNGPIASLPGTGAIVLPILTTLTTTGTTTLAGPSTITVTGGVFSTGALTNSPATSATISISDSTLASPAIPALVIGADAGANTTYAGTITNTPAGPGSLHKLGNNTQTLSGHNSYTGNTLIDGGTLVIAANNALPPTSPVINNATLSISAPNVPALTLSGAGTLSIASNDRLTLTGTTASKQTTLTLNSLAVLNIGNAPFILEPTPASLKAIFFQTINEVASAKASNGGITSSAVNGNPSLGLAVVQNASLSTPFTTFGGQPVDANSILIAPALLGDADLSGNVDLNDLNAVLNHLGQISNAWSTGNFDGAATIDLNDLNAVLNHLGTSYANSSTALQSPLLPATIPTPEPASLALLALATPLLRRRRR